ncbi:MAG: TonB-dependent receptor [Pseudomonadota bacterium]
MPFDNEVIANFSPKRRALFMGACSSALCCAAPTFAVAQDEAIAREGVDTVIVTSQRREENLQDVPVAVTAFGRDAIDKYGLDDVQALQALTPGFNYGASGEDARPSIRGANVNLIEANADPNIGLFVDGVFASRTSQMTMPFVDVERIEVLRGPQGTLFGRNTSAGSINIIPARPTSELEYGGEVTLGNFETVNARGYLNLPLGDATAARFAFARDTRGEGYVNNIGPGNDYFDNNDQFYRAAIRHEFDRGDVQFSGHYYRSDDAGGSTLGYAVIGSLFETNPVTGARILVGGEPVAINPRVLDGIPDLDGVDLGTPVSSDPYEVDYDQPTFADTQSWLVRGELNYALTDDINFMLLASHWDHNSQRTSENDFTSIPAAAQLVDFLTDGATTQIEAQFSSTGSSRLQWVFGGFYYIDDQAEEFFIEALPGSALRAANVFPDGLVFNRFTDVKTNSIAVYGQATYDLTDQLSITAGGRYTSDDKEYAIANPSGVAGGTFTDDETFEKFTWRAGLEYDVSDTSLLYLSAATGFRSGGFNRQPDQEPFDSETALSFELGSKNDFFDNRLRLNVAGYYVEYKDLQTTAVALDPTTGQSLGSFFLNAATAESYGVEIEFQSYPAENLFFGGAITLQESQFVDFPTASNPFSDSATVDLSGSERPLSPTWSASFVTSYDFDLQNGWGLLRPQVIAEFSDGYFTNDLATEIDRQDSFARLNASLTFVSASEVWEIEGFVRNATNEAVLDRIAFGGSNAAFANYQPPRTWGVTLRANF